MENKSKKTIRKSKKIKRKSDKQKIDELIEKYKNLTDTKLLTLSEEIINSNMSKNEKELNLTALKHIVDDKLFKGEYFSDEIEYSGQYPDYSDKDFNKKIYKKKEFYINKTKKLKSHINYDVASKSKCSGFKSSNVQKFVKTYISPNTPYNGLLLFHGVGVGKTCSSISIAEGFIPELKKMDKKVYILLNPSIKENFMKNIFNIEKVKKGDPLSQCTRDKYLKLIGDYKDINQLKNKAERYINKQYKFMGYITFANMIEKIENKINKLTTNPSLREKLKIKEIKSKFDNSVMIIDEVHNIKETDASLKVLPPVLEYVVKIVTNMKLILLSATPMFDNPTEIIFLLNLLLMNDKKPTVKIGDIFDKNYDFVTDERGNMIGRDLLLFKSRGYISYMRGENPLSFPIRLFPKDNLLIKQHNFPKLDVENKRIPERLKHMKIIGCKMQGHQLDVYNSMEDTKFGAFNLPGMMTSNIVFPKLSKSDNSNSEKMIGTAGFNSVFTKYNKAYQIKKGLDPEFLDIDKIGDYSSKIKMILSLIQNSKGIIFIYSQFIWSGLMPLALALEYNGYNRIGGNLLGGKRKPDVMVDSKNRANYIIISGNKELSNNSYENYLKLESENINGEKVKVILGSETAAEGLDFKYIREVHIMDPWYHLNKIEQIIGRGVRFCSHIQLQDPKMRNVTVHMYASTKSDDPSKDLETVDLKIYRTAEGKDIKMANVEYELKKSAVDCNLNINANKFVGDFWNKNVKMIDSKGNTRIVNLGDNDNSRLCNYNKCDFKCYSEMPEELNSSQIDTNTYSISQMTDQIYEIIDKIKNIYKYDIVYKLKEIVSHPEIVNLGYSEDLIIMALDRLVKSKEVVKDNLSRTGIIMYRGSYYVFEPLVLKSHKTTLNDIRKPSLIKQTRLNITDFKSAQNNMVQSFNVKEAKSNLPTDSNNIISLILNYNSEKLYNQNIKSFNNKSKSVNKSKYYSEIMNTSYNLIKELRLLEKNLNIGIMYLPSEKKDPLIRTLLLNKNKNEYESKVFNLLDYNILYYKRDVYYKDSINYSGEEKIWGYKIAVKNSIHYYKLDLDTKDKFVKAKKEDILSIKKSFNKKPKKEPANLIAYIQDKGNSVNFKIKDNSIKATKKTHVKTGSVCGNDGMKKEKIVSYIKMIDFTKSVLTPKITGVVNNNIITCVDHKLNENSKVIYNNIDSNTLLGLNKNEIYYAINVEKDKFKLSKKEDGNEIKLNGSNDNSKHIFTLVSDSLDNRLKTYFSKDLLCKQLEIYLLTNEKEKSRDKRWYYNAEESIEYELNKK